MHQYKELKKQGRLKIGKTTSRALGSYDKAKRLGHEPNKGENTWRWTTEQQEKSASTK